MLLVACPSSAAVSYTITPGETLWGIATANGVTTEELAAYNGLSAEEYLIAGETIEVPAAGEVAGATDEVAGDATAEPTSSAYATVTPSGAALGHIPSPYGELHLEASAADAWNAMREDALANYGVDIYPGGPVSAFRTYSEQAELYDAYLNGTGAPANPPGSSSHESGLAVDLATEEMRWVIDQIGAAYGWSKVNGPDEWWHVDYVGG
jgi:LysM repeat protein